MAQDVKTASVLWIGCHTFRNYPRVADAADIFANYPAWHGQWYEPYIQGGFQNVNNGRRTAVGNNMKRPWRARG